MLLLPQVVIVVEGTRGIDFLFGIIIAVVCANWIAQFVHKDGVYESELDHDGNVFFLRTEAPNALQYKTASDVRACLVISQMLLLALLLLLRLSCSFIQSVIHSSNTCLPLGPVLSTKHKFPEPSFDLFDNPKYLPVSFEVLSCSFVWSCCLSVSCCCGCLSSSMSQLLYGITVEGEASHACLLLRPPWLHHSTAVVAC